MREIKFRGKDISTGKWLYGSYIYQPVFACCFPQDGRTPPKETATRIYLPETFDDTAKICSVDPITVGQFTGLKDKNGVEIYEGDILSFPVKQKEPSRNFIVCSGEYTDYYTRFSQYGVYVMVSPIDDDGEKCISITQSGTEDMVVVGNVHDSPELLKK